MADTTAVAKTEEELEAEVMALMAGGKKKKKGDKKEKTKKDSKGDKKDKKKDKGENKKDKKKKTKKDSDGEGSDSPDSPAAADGEPSSPAVAAGEDDGDDDEPAAGEGGAEAAGEGKDIGVFSEAAKETYQYQLLLTRMYEILKRNNPEYAVKKRYVMAPPQVYRVGSTRTCWANFATICGQMNRAPDHVLSFFLAELGSEGSIDGSQRLMLKGRFVPKKIESLLRKYILEYVTCEMCRSPDTLLNRDPVSRLFFVNCKSCNASRAVSSIRAGFQALKRGQRRKERVGR